MEKDLKSLIILFKTYQFLFDHVKLTLVDYDISLNEFAALETLYSKGRLSTRELINYVLIANSSMTYVLDTLEKKEYIQRDRCKQDGRIQYLSLTEKGTSFFEGIFKEHYAHMRALFDVLTPSEEAEFQRLLKKVGKHAEGSL